MPKRRVRVVCWACGGTGTVIIDRGMFTADPQPYGCGACEGGGTTLATLSDPEAQVEADEKRLAELERENESLRERNERLDRLSSIIAGHRDDLRKANATLEADAEEWRALRSCLLHKMKGAGETVIVFADGSLRTVGKDGAVVDAPTPTALLAKLDALAPEPP